MPAPEVRAGDALRNPAEAAIITQIVRALEVGKVPLQDIGIISPYRAQVSSCCALLLDTQENTLGLDESRMQGVVNMLCCMQHCLYLILCHKRLSSSRGHMSSTMHQVPNDHTAHQVVTEQNIALMQQTCSVLHHIATCALSLAGVVDVKNMQKQVLVRG